MRIKELVLKIGTTTGILLSLTMSISPALAFNQEAEELRIDMLHERELKSIKRAREFHETLVAFQLKVSMIKSPDEVRRQSRIVLKSINENIDLYHQEIYLLSGLLNSGHRNYYLIAIKHRRTFIKMLEEEKTKWQGFFQRGKADPPEVQSR